MYKIAFFISNLIVCLVPGSARRHSVRGKINTWLLEPVIVRFVRKTWGERVNDIHFVRQNTPSRFVCVVNNKYFVKVFANLPMKKLKDFQELMQYIRPKLKVQIPNVVAHRSIPMYATERVKGKHITEFDKEFILQNQDKILEQVHKFIRALQRIKVDGIPNKDRFLTALQERTVEAPCKKPRQVFAHFDLNILNMMFDDELNLCAIIDWDAVSIANNPTTDTTIFLKYWNRWKRRMMKS